MTRKRAKLLIAAAERVDRRRQDGLTKQRLINDIDNIIEGIDVILSMYPHSEMREVKSRLLLQRTTVEVDCYIPTDRLGWPWRFNDELIKRLCGVDYAIIGDYAVAVYGFPKLYDKPVDLLIRPQDYLRITKLLGKLDNYNLVQIDQSWADGAISSVRYTKYGKIADIIYLILTLLWHRSELDDIDMVCLLKLLGPIQLKIVKILVIKYFSSEFADFNEIVETIGL